MTLKLHVPDNKDLKPRLTVFGVGGAGGNAVNNMIERSLEGVDFVVANTDAQALAISNATHKIQLGEVLTEGLGAGAKPEVGAGAAEESIERITDLLLGSHMCFITAGMGGGTGTGAAPIVAQAARQLGILTIGVVTKPFSFEGSRRMKIAEAGIEELQQYVDTLIIIPNQNLFRLATEDTTFTDAFGMADDVLYQGVKGVTDLMVNPGLVNLDFADIRSVMDEMGKAMMGTGEAEGEDRALIAAERAIDNPLLDEISLRGARGVLINITGGDDMKLYEVDEASNKIREEVDPEANIIFGASRDPEMTGRIRVSVVATGIDADVRHQPVTRTKAASHVEAPRAVIEVEEKAASVQNDLFARDEPRVEIAEELTIEVKRVEAPHDVYYASAPLTLKPTAAEPVAKTLVERANPVAEAALEASRPTREEVIARRDEVAATQPASAQPVERSSQDPAEKTGRFSINSMINRIAGHEVSKSAPIASRHAPSVAAPKVNTVAPESHASEVERERVDIPAFLRRQAN